jgi:hypothetical protein
MLVERAWFMEFEVNAVRWTAVDCLNVTVTENMQSLDGTGDLKKLLKV